MPRLSMQPARLAIAALVWCTTTWSSAEESPPDGFRYEERPVALEAHHLESLDTRFPIDEIARFTVSMGNSLSYRLDVARYRDSNGTPRRAIVHLPADRAVAAPAAGTDPYRFRRDAWNDLSRAVSRHTGEGALFLGWWDNMQRLHLHTGRRGRPRHPDPGAYVRPEQRAFWETIAGGILEDESLVCLSGRLLEAADRALARLAECAWRDEPGPLFLLVSTDDLSHVQELSHLADRAIPLDTRLFSSQGDIHGLVASVRTWAGQGGGTGSHLVQPSSGYAVRAWRVTDRTFEDSLLVRLLPFSSSLERSLPERARLVYQSATGAYLSIYEIARPR